jgi:hypothetical protein
VPEGVRRHIGLGPKAVGRGANRAAATAALRARSTGRHRGPLDRPIHVRALRDPLARAATLGRTRVLAAVHRPPRDHAPAACRIGAVQPDPADPHRTAGPLGAQQAGRPRTVPGAVRRRPDRVGMRRVAMTVPVPTRRVVIRLRVETRRVAMTVPVPTRRAVMPLRVGMRRVVMPLRVGMGRVAMTGLVPTRRVVTPRPGARVRTVVPPATSAMRGVPPRAAATGPTPSRPVRHRRVRVPGGNGRRGRRSRRT